MPDRRKLMIALFALLVIGMVCFALFRHLVVDDVQTGGLQFDATLHGSTVRVRVQSTLLEKGDVKIVDARLDGRQALDKLPIDLGEVGPWKEFELHFPARKGAGPYELDITARFNTLFSSGATHKTLTIGTAT